MGAFFHLQAVGLDNDGIAVGQVEHEKGSGEYKFFRHFINLAGRCAFQQIGGFVAPVIKYAVQDETDGIIGDNRGFACFGKKPEQIVQCFLTAFFPSDHFNRKTAPGRSKKMRNGCPFRFFHILKYSVSRNRGGV